MNDLVATALGTARASLIRAGLENPSEIELARQAYFESMKMREQSAETSRDPAHRDAEYMLRGYAGGLLLNSLDYNQFGADSFGGPGDLGNDIGNASGPLGAAAHNLKKIWNILTGNEAANSSNSLPASPPGGLEANWHGWKEGLLGKSPAELVADPDWSQPINRENSTLETPILPEVRFNNSSDDNSLFNPNVTTFDVTLGSTYYLDPAPGASFAYAVAGNTFRSIVVPMSQIWGNNPVTLWIDGATFQINQGQIFDFTTVVSAGVDSFWLTGVQMLTNAPFVAGFEFTNLGRVVVLETEIGVPDFVAVPEPTSLTLLGFGLFSLALTFQLRKTRQSHVARKHA